MYSYTYFCIFTIYIFNPTTNAEQSTECQSKCPQQDPNKLTIHIIPHSHMDAGWLFTFDKYYAGAEIPITQRYSHTISVRKIINGVIEALKQNPKRRFALADIAFFWEWWKEYNGTEKATDLQKLVKEGRLEIVNGGWVMNDEATTNYQSIIDQFSWGFRKLKNTLGECASAKIGWELDTFGHSRGQAAILQEMGFEAQILGRLHFRDKHKRLAEKRMEFYWKVHDSDETDTRLFTTILPRKYGTSISCLYDLLFNATYSTCDYGWKTYSFDVLEKAYLTKNMLMPIGDDFLYLDAVEDFHDIDSVMALENISTVQVTYSTPSCYVKAVKDQLKKESIGLQIETGDFFPYEDIPDSYWTGFYTTRPTLKRFERIANGILQSAKQLLSFYRMIKGDGDHDIESLREALGILQHHDAITGTSLRDVFRDYVRMLTKGIRDTERAVNQVIKHLLNKGSDQVPGLNLHTCLLTNTSICDISSNRRRFYVVVYNPLSRPVSHYVNLPVEDGSFRITGPDGNVMYEIFDAISKFKYVKEESRPASKDLIFRADKVPALGLKLFFIEKQSTTLDKRYQRQQNLEECLKNGYFGTKDSAGFAISKDGSISEATIGTINRTITQHFFYYSGFVNLENQGRRSGPYVFAPLQINPNPIKLLSTTCARGRMIDQVTQKYDHNITQTIRVYKNADEPFIEFDWLVGDLQPQNGSGIEIITRYTISDFENDNIFYTDSNGRQIMRRQLKKDMKDEVRKQNIVSGNYYPVTSEVFIRDELENIDFAVMNDRSQGGSSLCKGCIELMVHRIAEGDDGLGVGELLLDTEYGLGIYARGKHYLTFGRDMKSFRRGFALKKLLEPWILLGDATHEGHNTVEKLQHAFKFEFEGLKKNLPENIHILTLEPWDNCYLLRLENILQKNGSSTRVDLNNLFTLFNVTSLVETYLGGDRKKPNPHPKNFVIDLKPSEIRTFLMETDKINDAGHLSSKNTNITSDATKKRSSSFLFICFLVRCIYSFFETI